MCVCVAAPISTLAPVADQNKHAHSQMMTQVVIALCAAIVCVLVIFVILFLVCVRRRRGRMKHAPIIPEMDHFNPFYARYNMEVYIPVDEWEFDRKL